MSESHEAQIEQLFYEAFEAHSDALFKFCSFKIADREQAKDLVQKAFERFWLSLKKGNEIVNPRAYLYKTLKFLIIDEYRSNKKIVSLESLQEQGFEPSMDSEKEKVSTKMEFEHLREVMKKLAPKYEEVLILRYVNELSLKEVAAILKIRDNVVSVRLNRAIKQLEQLVQT